MGRRQGIPRYFVDERLRRLREERQWSRETLAVKMAVSLDTIARWEQGDPVKGPDCKKLAKVLGVPFEQLTGRDYQLVLEERLHLSDTVTAQRGAPLPPGAEPLPTEYVKVPLLGHCPASAKQVIHDEVLGWEYLPRDIVRGRRVYLLQVQGDSMNRAGIDDGDRVIVAADQSPENGKVVVALVDGECTIKRWHRGEHAITLTPDSTNPKHQPQTFTKINDVLARGVVVGVWMKRVK